MGNARPIVSGILVVIGLALVANRYGSSKIADAGSVTTDELQAQTGSAPRLVALPSATLDWPNRRFRSHKSAAFYPHDPRDVATIADPAEMIARREELTGRFVRMTTAPEPKGWFYLVKRSLRDPTHTDRTVTSLYAPVPDTNAKAWIVSESLTAHDDPKSKAFLSRRSHVGQVRSLFDVYDGALLATEYGKNGGRAIPPDAVALDTEKPPPPESAVDTWAPIAGTKNSAWAVIEGTPPDPPASLSGVVERVESAVLDAEIAKLEKRGVDYAPRRVLWLGDTDAFRATHREYERISVIGLVLLAAGLGLVAAHLVLRKINT